MVTVELPDLPPAQTASWLGLFDLADRLNDGWTLVGGQLVQLHCFERSVQPFRATTDIDTVLDVRAYPSALHTVTRVLSDVGFVTDLAMSVADVNHRWRRGDAMIDVLIPRHLGPVASARGDIHGAPGLETPGAQKQLDRSQKTTVVVGGRSSLINRPSIVGSLIGKASALLIPGEGRRHLQDFAVLSAIALPEDFANDEPLNALDRDRIAHAIGVLRRDHRSIVSLVDGAPEGLERLAAHLTRTSPRVRPAAAEQPRSVPEWATRRRGENAG